MTINRNLSILAEGISSAGVLGVSNGGSGATTLTGYLIGNGTGAFTASATIPTSALNGTINLTSQVSGILPIANGGTAQSSFTAGYVHFGSFSTSANFFWNSSTNCLGIGLTNGTSKLEVAGTGSNNGGANATYEGTIKINEAGSTTLQTTGGLEFKGSVFGSGYGSKIFSTDNGTMLFGVRQNSATWTETMRIDGSGNVLIGTSVAPSNSNNLKVAGLIFPQQAATASAPSYVKGAIYFDTTLNKLRVGGATAWETITSI